VLDGSDNVLATGVAVSNQVATLVYTATGLTANSSNTYKVVAVINGSINSATATVTALTRRFASGTTQVIDDFVNNNMGWDGQNGPILTIPATNALTAGNNASPSCAMVYIASGKAYYTGLQNTKEAIAVGPTATYQYLHIKMNRDADVGGISVNFNKRNDISTAAQLTLATQTVSTPEVWTDYVFDLRAASVTDKTYFSFYISPNRTSGNVPLSSNSYIDDVYLSNDATPSTANLTIPVTLSASAGGSVSANSSYFSGDNATVVATPSSGYNFINWTESSVEVSTDATYSFPVSTARTLVANFDFGTSIHQLNADNFVTVKGKDLEFSGVSGMVEIYNLMGSLVTAHKPLNSKISLTSGGVYILKMTTEKGIKVQKVIAY
jgi:hypothetical protein